MKTDPARAAQDEKILRMRVSGLSLRAIGEAVGLSHQGVADRITAALDALVNPAAEQYRALEAERLDDLTRRVYGVLAEADTGEMKLKAVDRLTRLSESRRKLWALDMPQQLDVALGRRLDIEGEVVADAVGAALAALDLTEDQERHALEAATAVLAGGEPPAPAEPGRDGGVDLQADFAAVLAAEGIDRADLGRGEDDDDDD